MCCAESKMLCQQALAVTSGASRGSDETEAQDSLLDRLIDSSCQKANENVAQFNAEDNAGVAQTSSQ